MTDGFHYCTLFRFLSSSLKSSLCSSSLSAVSAGLRMWAMLPLLVGGPELSLSRPGFPRPETPNLSPREEPQDQVPLGSPGVPLPFVANGGVPGRELLEWVFEAAWRLYVEKL